MPRFPLFTNCTRHYFNVLPEYAIRGLQSYKNISQVILLEQPFFRKFASLIIDISDMGVFLTILSILGSITSIYAFVFSIKLKSVRNIIAYAILLITSAISGICFTLYQRETDAQIQLEKRKKYSPIGS